MVFEINKKANTIETQQHFSVSTKNILQIMYSNIPAVYEYLETLNISVDENMLFIGAIIALQNEFNKEKIIIDNILRAEQNIYKVFAIAEKSHKSNSKIGEINGFE